MPCPSAVSNETSRQPKSNSKVSWFPICSQLSHRIVCPTVFWHPPHLISLIDRKPGDIQALTDFMLEDYKNFPKVPEFGEETARYIRKEMEDTWGSDHLSVLPEDKAQHWILGVGTLFSLLDQEWFLVPLKPYKYFRITSNALILSTNRPVVASLWNFSNYCSLIWPTHGVLLLHSSWLSE